MGQSVVEAPGEGRGAPALELEGVTLRYPGGGGVLGVDLRVDDGERLAVVGPSGSGKTTLLRLIAGLEEPASGAIRIGGASMSSTPPRRRGVAMVFQDQPPYPFLDVLGNLAFGLRARGVGRPEAIERAAEVARRLGIEGLLKRRPGRLSGGEQRRVVLGRALAVRSRLTLLDEPFASLDAPLRAEVRGDLIDLHDRQGGALILVTHDQGEALAFGHRIAVVRDGRIIQIGSPFEIYHHPRHRFVAEFIGNPGASIVRCGLRFAPDAIRVDGLDPGASWTFPRGDPRFEVLAPGGDRPIDLAFRPEQIERLGDIEANADSSSPTLIGRVDRVEPLGFATLARVKVGTHRLWFRTRLQPAPTTGDRVVLRLHLHAATAFEAETGASISTIR